MQAELNRKLSTVYFSDIVGYTRLMGKDENAAFELMKENLRIHQEVLADYRGEVIKELGDGILAVFGSATDALSAGLEIQKRCIKAGHYQLRIGLQSGEIIFDHGDVFGDAVNVASRIQSVGVPSSIVFSDRVCKEIYQDSRFKMIKLGGFDLKNVAHTLELYALTNAPLSVPKHADILGNIKYQEGSPWKNRIGLAAIVILFAALLYSVYWGDPTWQKDKSVAVLPFQNLSGSKDFDYFPIALTENLIDQLSKISSIKTISYKTMESFKNPNSPLDSIGKVIDVSAILKGTVENLESGVRINLQLVDVKKNKNIWTESYIREGSNIPQFQNDLAREIARILDARLTAEEATQIGKGETRNPEAYDLLFKAKALIKTYNDSSLLIAAEYLKEAIKLDQNYALAYTWLAKTYYEIGYNHPGSNWQELSLEMSAKALELEPNLAEASNARGVTYYELGQFTKAKNSIDLAYSLNPGSSAAIGNYATISFAQGDLFKAQELQKKSAKLDPTSYIPYQNLGWVFKILGDYKEAHKYFEKSIEKLDNPTTYQLVATTYILEGKRDSAKLQAKRIMETNNTGYSELGFIYYYLNEVDSSLLFFEKAMSDFPSGNFPKYASFPIPYAYLLKQKGNTQLADSILNTAILIKTEAINQGYEDYYLPYDLAHAFAVKNQYSESLKYLKMAYERGWRDYFFTEYNSAFKNLKNDPQYLKIINQIHLDIQEVKSKMATTSLERDR